MARAAGIKLDIDGLDELVKGAGKGADLLREVMRDILRGPFGHELLRDMKARASDHIRSGYTISRMRVRDDGREGVQVGIASNDTAQHPTSKRANAKSIGVWLESGTRMHLIPTKVAPWTKLSFGGRVVSRVAHPGTRGHGIVAKTLKAARGDAEREILRELDRRLGAKMNTRRGA